MNSYNLKFLRVNKTIYGTYTLTETFLRYKNYYKKTKDKWNSYDSKMLNAISRARTSLFNIVKFNKFEYFFTQTFSSRFNREDLNLLVKKFSAVVRNLRKIYKDKEFYYIVVPELHEDNKSWHLHGFLSADFILDTYINNNGFISSKHLDKIGFNSFSKIRDYVACCLYALEYINKDVAINIPKGCRLYYCSKGLKRDNLLYDLTLSQIAPVHYNFKNEFVFKTELNENKYYNFITNMDKYKSIILDYKQYKM